MKDTCCIPRVFPHRKKHGEVRMTSLPAILWTVIYMEKSHCSDMSAERRVKFEMREISSLRSDVRPSLLKYGVFCKKKGLWVRFNRLGLFSA